jgi:hypothetical protein
VISATIWCCFARGALDGIFYFWEDHYETGKRNKLISVVKRGGDPDVTKRLIAKNLEEAVINSMRKKRRQHCTGKLLHSLQRLNTGPNLPCGTVLSWFRYTRSSTWWVD